MKKFFSVLFVILLIVLGTFALSACDLKKNDEVDNGNSNNGNYEDNFVPHKHNWSTEYSMDSSKHWFACDGCNEKKFYSAHIFNNNLCECGCIQKGTEGLEYALTEDGTSYKVVSLGTVVLDNVVISSFYNNKLVTEIGYRAFEGCSGVSFSMGNNIKIIGANAFADCKNLGIVSIPNGVTTIGYGAFKNCTSLSKVTIGKNVTTLSTSAFQNCTSLQEIEIHKNITTIGEMVFDGCESLTKIEVDEENPNYSSDDGIMYDKDKTDILCVPLGIEDNVYVPLTITEISRNDFSFRNKMKGISMQATVKNIEFGAFEGCTSLKSIMVPSLSNGNYSHFGYLFGGTTFIEHIKVVPKSLTSVAIVTGEIKEYAFAHCDIEIATIFEANEVEGNAFYQCLKLREVSILEDVKSVSNNAFAGCPIIKASIPTWAIPSIKKGTLTNVEIIAGNDIPSNAFANCDYLSTIKIPNSVTSIGGSAFVGCTGLKSIIISNNVTSIGESAFSGCSKLTIYCEFASKPSGWDSY